MAAPRVVRLGLVAGALASGACSAIMGLEPLHFDEPVSAADGGTDTGTTPDAPAVDAGIDVAVDAGAKFCDLYRDAAYCQAFDTASSIDEIVTDQTDLTVKPKLTTDTFTSPPYSLRFIMPPDKAVFTTMKKSLVTDRAVRLSFSWKLGLMETRDGQNIQMMTLRRNNDQVAIQRACSVPGGDAGRACKWYYTLTTGVGTAGSASDLIELPKRLAIEDGWARVVMEAKFATAGGYIKLSMDGTSLVDQSRVTSDGAVVPPTEPMSATVGFGVLQGNEGATDTAVDDVVVEVL